MKRNINQGRTANLAQHIVWLWIIY